MHPIPLRFVVQLQSPSGGAPVAVDFQGQAVMAAPADPVHVGSAIQEATREVVQQKLQASQVAFPTLSMSLGHFIGEISARAAQPLSWQNGVLSQLQLTCSVPQAAVAPAAGQVMSGSQIAANVAGNFASNAIASAMPGPPRVQANIGGMKLRFGPGSASVGDQVQDEIKDRILHYAIVGGVLVFVSLVCVIAIAVKLVF
ncbi:MAG: hypothetical protein KC619_30350 [Myxococcales bacterium]|nr:hypothetical protein [Myxococcales bacterium]